jgi:hypothetical protein
MTLSIFDLPTALHSVCLRRMIILIMIIFHVA